MEGKGVERKERKIRGMEKGRERGKELNGRDGGGELSKGGKTGGGSSIYEYDDNFNVMIIKRGKDGGGSIYEYNDNFNVMIIKRGKDGGGAAYSNTMITSML